MTNLIVQLTDLPTVIYTKTDMKEINKQCFVEKLVKSLIRCVDVNRLVLTNGPSFLSPSHVRHSDHTDTDENPEGSNDRRLVT